MLIVKLRAKVIHIALIGIVLFSVLTPNTASAKPSVVQSNLANPSANFQTEGLLMQTPDALIQCVGSYSACSDLNPNTTVTETIDFTN